MPLLVLLQIKTVLKFCNQSPWPDTFFADNDWFTRMRPVAQCVSIYASSVTEKLINLRYTKYYIWSTSCGSWIWQYLVLTAKYLLYKSKTPCFYSCLRYVCMYKYLKLCMNIFKIVNLLLHSWETRLWSSVHLKACQRSRTAYERDIKDLFKSALLSAVSPKSAGRDPYSG